MPLIVFCVIFFVAMGKQSARLMEKGYYDPEGNRKVSRQVSRTRQFPVFYTLVL